MKTAPVKVWVSDFGDIKLPDDFPFHIFRKNGWWDRRYGALRRKWEAWIAAEERLLRLPYTIPNRLHGVAINERGEAI